MTPRPPSLQPGSQQHDDALLTALGLGYARSAVAMLVVDDESVVVHANPAAGTLLDGPPTGRELVDLVGDGTPLPPAGEVREVSLRTTGEGLRHAELRRDPFCGPSGESLQLVQLHDVTADRLVRDELQESRRLVQQLVDADPRSVVLTFDTSLRLVTASASLLPLLQEDMDALVGRRLRDFLPPTSYDQLEPHYLGALEGAESDLVLTTSEASGRRFAVHLRPLLDRHGEVKGGLSIARDVTEETDRRTRMEQLQALTPVGQARLDTVTGWTVDDRLLEIVGVESPDDLFPVSATLMSEAEAEQADRNFAALAQHGGRGTFPISLTHGRTGQRIHLHTAWDMEVGPSGQLLHAVGTAIDVTESIEVAARERAAHLESLAQRTRVLRQLSDSLAASSVDVEQELQAITEMASAAIGEAAVLSVPTAGGGAAEWEYVAHSDPHARKRLSALVRGGARDDGHWRGLVNEVMSSAALRSSVTDPGRRIWSEAASDEVDDVEVVHFIAAPCRHEGTAIGLLLVHRGAEGAPYDETDEDVVQVLADRIGSAVAAERATRFAVAEVRKRQATAGRLEGLVREQKDLLELLSTTEVRVRSLLAEAVHDDPLQLVVAAMLRMDLLRNQLDDGGAEEAERIMGLLERSIEQLRKLIIALTPPDLSGGLGGALRGLAEGIFLGTSTEVVLSGPMHVHLTQDVKEGAYRIMREALVNVRKHARADTVTVRLHEVEEAVILSVSDDGVGSDSLTTGPGHLGLITMRARARAQGADLRVDSAPGRGTTVVLTLPTNDPHPSWEDE